MIAIAHAVRSGETVDAGLSNDHAEQTARAARSLQNRGSRCLVHPPKLQLFEREIERGPPGC
ncbi:MAG: hypothetical protein RL077_6473 [Verrucomicrobiota bacterium]|jgi:aryl-alcohol dehydrogenase-like predicted oxidoreductase